MKSFKGYILFFFILPAILLVLPHCGSRSIKKSQHFGKLPHLFTEYRNSKAPLIKEVSNTKKFGEKLEIKEEIEKLDQKFQKKFEKEYKKLDFPLHLPYEGKLESKNLALKDIYIKDISLKGRLRLIAKVIIKKDNICTFVFARFTDEEDNPVNQNRYIILTPPTYNKGEIVTDTFKKGKIIKLVGFYDCDKSLTKAEKINIKSEREYFANK